MEAQWNHLSGLAIVDLRWLFGLVILGDMGLTLAHSIEEFRGKLWRYFGEIVGVRISDAVGIPIFSVALVATLWVVALVGMGGLWLGHLASLLPGGTAEVSTACVAFLIGARLSDAWISHFKLERDGYSPNPGVRTARYYVGEGAFLALLFSPGLASHLVPTGIGILLGTGLFVAVRPTIRLFRLVPSLRTEPRPPFR